MKDFLAFQLAVKFHRSCESLELAGPIRDQLIRASLSIALNLCEGRGKPTRKDQLRYFHIAMGSVRECQGALIIAGLEGSAAWDYVDRVAAALYRLIKRAR